jgi:Flp pilus assembly pilin Flp
MDSKSWMRLDRDTRGATMVEYIVIVALILLVALTAWQKLGTQVKAKTDKAATELEKAGN